MEIIAVAISNSTICHKAIKLKAKVINLTAVGRNDICFNFDYKIQPNCKNRPSDEYHIHSLTNEFQLRQILGQLLDRVLYLSNLLFRFVHH